MASTDKVTAGDPAEIFNTKAIMYDKLVPEHPEFKWSVAYAHKELDADPTTPFASDQELFDHYIAYYFLKNDALQTQTNLATEGAKVRTTSKEANYEGSRVRIEVLARLTGHLQDVITKKKALMSKPPRVSRLAEKWKLSPKEENAIIYVCVATLTQSMPRTHYLPQFATALMDMCDMSWLETMHFLSAKRQHLKENLFDYFESERPLTNSLTVKQEIAYALLGLDLTSEQLIKLDRTALAELFEEDTKQEGESTEKREEGEEESTKGDEKGDVEAEGGHGDEETPPQTSEDPLDIQEFMRREIAAETSFLGDATPDQELGKPDFGAVEEDEDELRAYRTDLEYLEDQVAALFCKLQVVQMRDQMQRNKAYNYSSNDDYDAKMRLRQTEATARAKAARVEKRMELTRKTAWQPRVEFTIPDYPQRVELWKKMIPPECPRAADINFETLASKFAFAGGSIKSAVVRAAARAALRSPPDNVLKMDDLIKGGVEEESKARGEVNRASGMYT
eukprot:Colp12_sorted_trinity150504_noHs@26340